MPIRLLVLARKNPVERMSSSTCSGLAAASEAGIGIGGEERGRHHVDPGVGALRGQDGGRQQLERVLEVQRAQLGRRARVAPPPGARRPGGPGPSAVLGFATGSRYRVTLAAVDAVEPWR